MSAWLELALPVRPRGLPAPDVVECWLVDLTELELPDSGSTERARRQMQRLHRQFVLRLILGAYLERPGKDVALIRGPSGKPALAPALAASGLQFNLSHSGDWLALALTRDVAVGVDIEQHRAVRRALDLARRYFSPPEADELGRLDETARSEAFFRLWTAREACIKAMGTSLAESLSSLVLEPADAMLLAVPAGWPEPVRWSLLRPALPLPLELCVAVPAAGMALDLLRLSVRPPG